MPNNPGKQLRNLRERIEHSEDISEDDRAAIEDFDRRLDLLNQHYSEYRHLKLLRHVTIIAEHLDGQLAACLDDREAAENIVAWINREYTNEETNRDYRSALRVFGTRVAGEDGDPPESLAWVPTGTSSEYDPTPDPREMLRWEDDILPMLEAARNDRDRAMVAVGFDAGFRGGEFKSLRVGDIQNHRHGLQATVDGKQGRRTVLLVPGAPYLADWLSDHPAGDDPDAPLWSRLHSPDRISDRMISKTFNTLADRAGVTRPVTLTNFRKSSAAHLASQNLSQAHLEAHHGWVTGSDAAARYIVVFGEASDREIARIHGRDVSEEEPDDIAPIECPTCGRDNAHDAKLCDRCGQALDHSTALELESVEQEFDELLARLDADQAVALLEDSDAFREEVVRRMLLE